MISISQYVEYTERRIRERKYFKEISSTHLDFLKSHSQTRSMKSSPNVLEILNFVLEKTGCDPVLECNIWSLTNKSIDDLIEHTKNNAKNIEPAEKRSFYLDMAQQYKFGRAFYTLDTKEVFYITDIDDRLKKENRDGAIKKPDRFTESEWRKIHIRSSIVHELFHFHMDYTTNSQNEMMHERHAYTGMIDWCREKEKLSDEEIAKFIINSYGQRLAMSKNPRLRADTEKDLKYIEDYGYNEGIKLIKQRDALKPSFEEVELKNKPEKNKNEVDVFDFKF